MKILHSLNHIFFVYLVRTTNAVIMDIVRPPTGLFYIERDPHSRTEIGERDIVLSAQE
jgi:hypothetical protein